MAEPLHSLMALAHHDDPTGGADGEPRADVTRLEHGVLHEVGTCDHTPGTRRARVVGVIRGFSTRARSRSRQLRQRLGVQGLETVELMAAPEASSPTRAAAQAQTLQRLQVVHCCVLVDVTGGTHREPERLAAELDRSLVRLGDTPVRPGTEPTTRVEPVLVGHPANPSAADPEASEAEPPAEPLLALTTLTMVPVRGGLGTLRLQIGDHPAQVLEPGSAVRMAVGAEAIHIQSARAGHATGVWMYDDATISAVEGAYTVVRDGKSVTDLRSALRVEHVREGFTVREV